MIVIKNQLNLLLRTMLIIETFKRFKRLFVEEIDY